MPEIPKTKDIPLLRADFSDEAGWDRLVAAATRKNDYGFVANVDPVGDRAFDGAGLEALTEAASRAKGYPCVFVADATAIGGPGYPILCIEARAPHRSFRVVAGELCGVENNLSIANMGFEEFADAVDADGVFRGFK
jgi:hypothetical protein